MDRTHVPWEVKWKTMIVKGWEIRQRGRNIQLALNGIICSCIYSRTEASYFITWQWTGFIYYTWCKDTFHWNTRKQQKHFWCGVGLILSSVQHFCLDLKCPDLNRSVMFSDVHFLIKEQWVVVLYMFYNSSICDFLVDTGLAGVFGARDEPTDSESHPQ